MPIIAKDKLDSLMQNGKARLDRPGRFRIQPKPAEKKPKPEPKALALLQAVRESIDMLARQDKGGSSDLLQRIEALLVQIAAAYAAPPQPAATAIKQQKTNWTFKINRDRNGRLESIEAVPEEGE